ncbi:MAG: ABC transporter permease [Sphingomonadales bacterium]
MSSKRILHKLLSKTQNPKQLIGGIAGTFIGVLLLSLAVQIYFEYKSLFQEPKNDFGKQYIIINKKISALNTLSGGISAFSADDIKDIKKLPSVQNVGSFTANRFNVLAELSMGNYSPGIRTELFFEAVDDRFIDNLPEDWGWKEGQESIPLILPADFINLYNFTFAPARGLPLISPNTIKMARFNLRLTGGTGLQEYSGRVVGYSQRLNSVLVPKNFMDITNNALSPTTEKEKKGRLIVEIDQSKSGELYKLIKEKNWETNESRLMTSKFAFLLEMILVAVGILGIVILFLAFFSTILYVLLSINKAKYEIDTLLLLGVPRKHIINWYSVNIGIIYTVIIVTSSALVWFIKSMVADYLGKFGFNISAGINPLTIISAVAALSVVWLIQYLSIRKLS